MSEGKYSDFVSLAVKVLNSGVVGVFVGGEESTANLASVRVLSLSVEDVFVQVDVVDIDGAVERDGNHLRDLVGLNSSRDARPVRRAEAVRQGTLAWVTVRGPVGISLHR